MSHSSVIRVLAIALLAAALPTIAAGQGVLVAPPGIFIDHRARSGALELYNPAGVGAEISIATVFGYPVTDSAGTISLYVNDVPGAEEPSAAEWIQAYPRRLTLAPGERQTVRLLGRPPASLPDGEYWTRLVVSARSAPVPAEQVADSTGIRIGVSIETRTVVAVLYRKGRVETSLTLDDARAEPANGGDSLAVRLRLVRGGNAAFIGSVRGTLVDAGGREVGAFATPVAVYRELEPRFSIATRGLPAGDYTLRLQVDTQREDVRRDHLLPVPTLRQTLSVTLPTAGH